VTETSAYTPVFSAEVAEFLLGLPRKRQRRAIRLVRRLASHPFGRSDYVLPDASGRLQEHLLLEDFVFVYWLDHVTRELRITDLEDAS
jgi:hypothetical protein